MECGVYFNRMTAVSLERNFSAHSHSCESIKADTLLPLAKFQNFAKKKKTKAFGNAFGTKIVYRLSINEATQNLQ
jgi:hypothetical protein